jgi:hypothetical protein
MSHILTRRQALTAGAVGTAGLMAGLAVNAKAAEATDDDKPLTAEFCAGLDFEPWTELQMPPTNEEWVKLMNPHLVNARLCWHLLQQTKAGLVDILDGMDYEMLDETLNQIEGTEHFFEYFYNVLHKTRLRIIVAGPVIELREVAS